MQKYINIIFALMLVAVCGVGFCIGDPLAKRSTAAAGAGVGIFVGIIGLAIIMMVSPSFRKFVLGPTRLWLLPIAIFRLLVAAIVTAAITGKIGSVILG